MQKDFVFDLKLSDKTELNISKKNQLHSAFLYKVQTVPTTQRCCESSPCWTTGLWPAVYRCNYTLLATHLPAKLRVLVCLAPGNGFHLYEINAVEGRASLTHLSSHVYVYDYCMWMCMFSTTQQGFLLKIMPPGKHSCWLETVWGPSATNICFQRV